MKKHNFIYKTTCLVTGKIYIGKHSTDDLNDGYIGCGVKSQKSVGCMRTHFHNAVQKHGYENFKKEILELCDVSMLDQREVFWIDFFRATDNSIGYNSSPGGRGGDHFTNNPNKEAIRKRMSEGSMGQPGLKGEKNPMFGKVGNMNGRKGELHPRFGMKMSEEFCERFRGKNHPMYGRHRSGKDAPNYGKKFPITQCPHCGKEGGSTGMTRWHFDNCKKKLINS